MACPQKNTKNLPPKEKMWLTGAACIRYNEGCIFWRGLPRPFPNQQTAAPPELLLGRESRLEIK